MPTKNTVTNKNKKIEIKEIHSTTEGIILAVEGWHCVCTVCGEQWFQSNHVREEPPNRCTRCEVTREHAEKSVKDFQKKVKAGGYKLNMVDILWK